MTTTESLFDEIERNNIEVYLGSMPAAKSALPTLETTTT